MFDKEITFDRFIRGAAVVAIVVLAILLINRLSAVLLPFFVAWLLAYLIYPLVKFIQHRLRVRHRVLSIVLAMLLVLGVITGTLALVIPATIREFMQVKDIMIGYIEHFGGAPISQQVNQFVREYLENNTFIQILQEKSVMQVIQFGVSQMWGLVSSVFDLIVGIFSMSIVVLYTVFILFDYENISQGWINLVPKAQRKFTCMVANDVISGMNAYFRGQGLVAMIVGILFCIGFLIIDFPMAIGLGIFIGFLNLVPYLQTIGFIPTILFALIKSAQTGENFWYILLPALAVFAIVQGIQDMYLVPRIMGKVMGLNPAVILLSLSIWGSLLGIIGLIIALPLTTLILSYYHRFVLRDESQTIQPLTDKKEKKE